MSRAFIQRVLALCILSFPAAAHACTVCMGDVNSKTAGAMNAAIFLMIGVIGTMLASLGAFAFYLSRRAANPGPPYTEADPSFNDPEDLS